MSAESATQMAEHVQWSDHVHETCFCFQDVGSILQGNPFSLTSGDLVVIAPDLRHSEHALPKIARSLPASAKPRCRLSMRSLSVRQRVKWEAAEQQSHSSGCYQHSRSYPRSLLRSTSGGK
jgi:hypothetical protein